VIEDRNRQKNSLGRASNARLYSALALVHRSKLIKDSDRTKWCYIRIVVKAGKAGAIFWHELKGATVSQESGQVRGNKAGMQDSSCKGGELGLRIGE
jgi:hypothetical protein